MSASPHNLAVRLSQLPASEYKGIKKRLSESSNVSLGTVNNVINGKSESLKVFTAIAMRFNCSIDDVLNPDFAFQVQNSELPTEEELAAELGLQKVA